MKDDFNPTDRTISNILLAKLCDNFYLKKAAQYPKHRSLEPTRHISVQKSIINTLKQRP